MTPLIQPFHLLVIALAGWLNRHQQVVIDYLIEENRVLKEQHEGQRLKFTDEQRIRLAVKASYSTCLASHAYRGEMDLCQKAARSTPCYARDHRFGTMHGEE